VAISSSGRVTGHGFPAHLPGEWGFTWTAPAGPVEWFAELEGSARILAANDAGIAVGVSDGPAAWNTATGETWNLSTLAGGTARRGVASDINEAGQIAGQIQEQDVIVPGPEIAINAVVWQLPDTLIVIDPLPGSKACVAGGINEVGQVIGICYEMDAAATTITAANAFVWKDGVTQALGGRTRRFQAPFTINDHGIIGGYETDEAGSPTYGFFWTPVDGTVPAATLPGTTGGFIRDSSNSGFFTGHVGEGVTGDAVRYQISAASSPEEAAGDLGDAVDTLVSEGSLGAGNGNALTSKLEAAARQAERGNCMAARNQLTAFIQQVEALEQGGTLSNQEASNLIDAAQAILDELDC
jgi:uncharacterized membrane protein